MRTLVLLFATAILGLTAAAVTAGATGPTWVTSIPPGGTMVISYGNGSAISIGGNIWNITGVGQVLIILEDTAQPAGATVLNLTQAGEVVVANDGNMSAAVSITVSGSRVVVQVTGVAAAQFTPAVQIANEEEAAEQEPSMYDMFILVIVVFIIFLMILGYILSMKE